jgi:hypothetical protein
VDELTGMKVKVKKVEKDDFVPEIQKRLARRTEADRMSVMSAYIARQEELRMQLVRTKKIEEESDAESESESEWETGDEDEEGEESEEDEEDEEGEVFTF